MFGTGIAKGMATTLRHFFGKKTTIQYPEERAPLPIGFRGLPRLVYDEDPEDTLARPFVRWNDRGGRRFFRR